MKILLVFLLCASCFAQNGIRYGNGVANIPPSGSPPPTPTWQQLTNLPSQATGVSAQPLIFSNLGDGNVYLTPQSGTSPSVVSYIFVAPESCLTTNSGNWSACGSNITTSTLSGDGTIQPHAMGVMPNGTVLYSGSHGGTGGEACVYTWNGSTSSPVWTTISGYTCANADTAIYNFANDQEGYTWIPVADNGDLWVNSAPNSTTFSKVITNIYSFTSGGGAGHVTSGATYQLKFYTLNGIEYGCAGGEGELDCVPRSQLFAGTITSWIPLFTTAAGFTNNFFGLDASATHILALRVDGSGNGNTVNRIVASTCAASPGTCPYTTVTAASGGYPGFISSNIVPSVIFMNGTTWLMANHTSSLGNFILQSTTDGATWVSFPAGGCTGGTFGFSAGALRPMASAHYIYEPCTITGSPNTLRVDRYGPI